MPLDGTRIIVRLDHRAVHGFLLRSGVKRSQTLPARIDRLSCSRHCAKHPNQPLRLPANRRRLIDRRNNHRHGRILSVKQSSRANEANLKSLQPKETIPSTVRSLISEWNRVRGTIGLGQLFWKVGRTGHHLRIPRHLKIALMVRGYRPRNTFYGNIRAPLDAQNTGSSTILHPSFGSRRNELRVRQRLHHLFCFAVQLGRRNGILFRHFRCRQHYPPSGLLINLPVGHDYLLMQRHC